jgi:DNA-binding MarR family transcriptional regulator
VYRFKQQKHQPNSPYSELHLRLIGLQKTTLTIEELDEIFEIVHLEPDSKKLKRTRLINELNVSKPNFIERERDESDKRRYLYKINY